MAGFFAENDDRFLKMFKQEEEGNGIL